MGARTLIDGMVVDAMFGSGQCSCVYDNEGQTQEMAVQVTGGTAENQLSGVLVNRIPKTGGNLFIETQGTDLAQLTVTGHYDLFAGNLTMLQHGTLDVSGTDAVISVRDTGVGIDDALLPHIFEQFRQGDAEFRQGHAGLGLGLAIAWRLIELHGGTILAESAGRGHGALFTVHLPLPESNTSLTVCSST